MQHWIHRPEAGPVTFGQGGEPPAGAESISEADWLESLAVARATPSHPLTRLAKADLWRRLTDEEAEMLDAALHEAPLRLRRIFEAAQYLDTADDDYSALRAGIVAALGEARADEVLAPTY